MKEVRVRAVENDEELRQANVLMSRVSGPDPASSYAWLSSFGAGYPGFRREHTRIALYGSQVVAALRLTTDTIRVGEARLKTGGLGWIATDGAWRRRGIISRVLDDTFRHLQEQRYHMSMLFGVSEYYRRWGFAPALTEYLVTVDSRLPGKRGPAASLKLRRVKPGDIGALQRLHGLTDGETACSLIRTQAHVANRWRQWEQVQVLTDGQGKVTAYFRGARQGDAYLVDEAGTADDAACAAVLRTVAEQARAAAAPRISLALAPAHPLILAARRQPWWGATETDDEPSGMLSLVNPIETLESMIPDWESRLVASALARTHAEVTLVTGRTAWRVRAHHGAVDVSAGAGINKITVSAQELVQLIVGFAELDEILAAKRRIVSAEGMALLREMFPKRQPYVWALDRF